MEGPVQTVGKPCVVCDERIKRASGTGGCPSCAVVFHRRCLERAGRCPECGEDYRAQQEAIESEQDEARFIALARGRALVLGALTLLVAAGVISLLAGAWTASFTPESLAAGGVRLTLTIGLSVLVFRGKKWAYQITIALALAAVLWSGQLALVRGPASLVAGGVYAAVLLLLLLPRTRDYLEAKRWKHLDAD